MKKEPGPNQSKVTHSTSDYMLARHFILCLILANPGDAPTD